MMMIQRCHVNMLAHFLRKPMPVDILSLSLSQDAIAHCDVIFALSLKKPELTVNACHTWYAQSHGNDSKICPALSCFVLSEDAISDFTTVLAIDPTFASAAYARYVTCLQTFFALREFSLVTL